MKCGNCKKEMEKIRGNHFHCAECEEIFEDKNGALKPVPDKKAYLTGLKENLKKGSEIIKNLASKFDVKFDDDDDEGAFF